MQRTLIYTLIIIVACSNFRMKADDNTSNKDSIVFSYTATEVVIQSFKSNDNISLQPISATVLSEQVLKERNISSVKDFSGFIPNLFIPDYGSKMTSPAYIRGIGSRINAPSVGLYVDGVPYFDRSTFDIGMEDIDRIEVLRGPQGTIYGRNTMGGIINIYTKSPFKYQETNVGLSAANYNTYYANVSHYGKLSDSFGYALSGNYMHTGGYITNHYTDKRANPMDAVSARVRLSWKAMPNLFLHLTSAYEYSDQDGYPYASYDDETNTISDVNYDSPGFFRRNMSTTGLNVQYSLDKVKFNSQSSFQYFDGTQGLDQDFESNPAKDYYVLYNMKQRMYSQEFNLKSVGDSNYEWLFGAFGFYQDFVTDNNINYSSKLQDVDTPSLGVALFHQSVINNLFTKGLSLTLGIRYDWEQIKSHTIISTPDESNTMRVTDDNRDKDTYSQVTPKVALQYTFAGSEIVYASVTKGYKSGGFNNTAQLEEDRTFAPEHSWSYEVGTKASCLNNLIYTDLSLFYIRWSDQQVSQNQPDGRGFILRNAGRSESKGVEANVHINALENLTFQLTYGYTHATFKEYDDKNGNDYAGKFLPMVPLNTFSAAVNYSIKMKEKSLIDKIIFNGQYTGLGKLYWKEDNIAEQSFYGILNVRTSFVKGNFSFDIWAKNIGKQDYTAYYFKSSAKSFAQRGKPFTCGVNLNLKF